MHASNERSEPAGVLSGFVTMSNFDLTIDPDGSNAFVTLISKKVGIFRLRVSFAMMSRFQHAVDLAVNMMRWRQHAFIDGGADSVASIKAMALRPNVENSDITYEGGEVVVLWQFDDAPPLAIKMSMDQAEVLANKYYALRRTAVN